MSTTNKKVLRCLFPFFLLLSSCANVIKTPIGLMRFAEVGGKDAGIELGATYRPLRNVFLAQESEKGVTSIGSRTDYRDTSAPGVHIGANFGSLALFTDGHHSGIQWQAIGKKASDAGKGNLAISVAGAYSDDQLSSTSIDLANRNSTLDGRITVNTLVAGLLTSYRFAPKGALGLNFFVQNQDAKGSGNVSGDNAATGVELTEKTTDRGATAMLILNSSSGQFGFGYTLLEVINSITDEAHLVQGAHFNMIFTVD